MRALRERYVGEEARNYEARRQGRQWQSEREAVRDALDRLTPRAVLDVPCGTGRFWPLYDERGVHATGLDLSRDMLDQARARGWELVEEGDVFDTGFLDGTFDLTVCVRLLNWMTRQECVAALAELARVTAQEGRVLVSIGLGHGKRGRTLLHDATVFTRAGLEVELDVEIMDGPGWSYRMVEVR